MRSSLLALVALIAAALTASPAAAAPKKVPVVTTLGVLADLTRQVGGDRVSVTALAKIGRAHV